MSKVLFLINIQEDHFQHGMLEVQDSQMILEPLLRKQEESIKTYYFNASYPAQHIRFASNHPWRYPGQQITLNGEEVRLFPFYCLQDTWGAQIHPAFQLRAQDQVIIRGQEAEKNPAYYWPDEDWITKLKEQGVQEIELAGLIIEPEFLEKNIEAIQGAGFELTLHSDLTKSGLLYLNK